MQKLFLIVVFTFFEVSVISLVREINEEDIDFRALNMIGGAKAATEILPNQVQFILYSRDNHGVVLYDDPEKYNLELLGKNPLHNLKFIIHGWQSSSSVEWVQTMAKAYLSKKLPNLSVILVNWNDLAKDLLYISSAENTELVGERVGQFIDKIINGKFVSENMIHLIGHSLGAHVAGSAGNNRSIGRITGLDPAKFGFEPSKYRKLSKEHAKFVDIIHTCTEATGILDPAGHIDFYPNGGVIQPGCNDSVVCSHERACKLFIESINNSTAFVSQKCPHKPGIPWTTPTKENCVEGKETLMGENCPISTTGVYYVETNPNPPYSKNT